MSGSAGDILRGMEVERQPVRVGRTPTVTRSAPVPVREIAPPSREDETLRLQELQREAQARGYQEGLRQGLAAAAVQGNAAIEKAVAESTALLAEQKARLGALTASLADARAHFLGAAEDDLVALCFETVCGIVTDHALQPDTVRATLRTQAGRLGPDAAAVLHVHPDDLPLVHGGADAGALRCVADPGVALGGCIVRGQEGGIDARLESVLVACRDALLSARARRRAEAQT